MKEYVNKIPIVFATNENYAPYAGVAITSLVRNASKKFFYDIYVFYTELSDDIIARFQSMGSKYYKVTCLDVNDYLNGTVELYKNFHYSKEMYYRIIIPRVLPQYEKAVYLDCDIVVLGDISKFYSFDVNGYILGAMRDIQHYASVKYVTDTLKLPVKTYINSGVILINCEEFRKREIEKNCMEILGKSKIKFRYPDQDLINIACSGGIKLLDQRWNYIWHYNFNRFNRPELNLDEDCEKKYQKLKNGIKIIHYTSNIKPWNNYNTYLTKFEFDYARKTPAFKDIFFDRFNKIAGKNYITLQFIDFTKTEIIITGAFYSIEDYLYHNKIYFTQNGKRYWLKFYLSRNIDIGSLCYRQNFFKIRLKIDEAFDTDIIFFRAGYKKPLAIKLGKYFPISQSYANKVFFYDSAMSVDKNILAFRKADKRTRKRYERQITRRIFRKKGSKCKNLLKVITRRFIRHNTKKSKKQVWLISDRIDSAGDNGEAFFRYLMENKNKGIRPYFVLEKSSPDYKRIKKTGKVLSPHSLKFKYIYLKSSAIISSHLPWELIQPFDLSSVKDFLLNRKIIFLQHGVIKDDLSLSYSRFNQGMDMFVTTAKNERDSIVGNLNYGLTASQVALTGLPRFDYYENEPENIIYLMPTWRKSLSQISDEDREKVLNSHYVRFYSELLQDNRLSEILNQYGYKLIFVPHPLAKNCFEGLDIIDRNIEVHKGKFSYKEAFKRAKLVITDYSSVSFDFAYLGKAIIYSQFDIKELYSGGHTYRKGYFDYAENGFGPVVTDIAGVVSALEGYLKNDCVVEDLYKNRAKLFFGKRDRQNSSRVFDRIIDLINKTYVPVFYYKNKSLVRKAIEYYRQNGLSATIKKILNYLRG